MKKHLIAAAVAAAVAVPAAAQVTMTGVLDLSPHSERKTTVGATSVKLAGTGNENAMGHAAGSRINFNMTEDLGGGLRVDGLLRLRYGSSEGTTGAADDYSLRLSGGFGALRLGRFTGFVGNIEAMSGAFAASTTAGGIGANASDFIGGSMSTNAATIAANTGAIAKAAAAAGAGGFDDTTGLIQYVSPSFSGVQVTLDLQNRSQDESTNAGKVQVKQTGIGVSYTAGPLQVQAATSDRSVQGVLALPARAGAAAATAAAEAAAAAKAEIHWIGANYNFGPATVFAARATREDKGIDGALTDDITLNMVGIQVRQGAFTIFASMYDGDDKNTNTAGAVATERRDLSGNQLAVSYALSKRTSAYAVTGKAEDTGATANSNFKRTETAIGLRHNF